VVCLPEARPADIGVARQRTLAGDLASENFSPTLLVWRAQPALLVTRQETRLPRFLEASEQMDAAGWPIVVRQSGGEACPVGLGTMQLAIIEPAVPGATMNAKYDALANLIQSTLEAFRIVTRAGSVAGAYCPGRYDLAVRGKKIAGLSQHWFRNRHGIRCVTTTASINVEEAPDVLADAVNQFYCSAGSPTRCQAAALTSVRLCAGESFVSVRALASAVMDQLESSAGLRGEKLREGFQPLPPVFLSHNN
jgi:lipoate-protein ligase A